MSGAQNRGFVPPQYDEGKRDAGWAGLRLAALCVGVGAYSGSVPPLETPVRDATDLFEAITKCPDCRAAVVRDPQDKRHDVGQLIRG